MRQTNKIEPVQTFAAAPPKPAPVPVKPKGLSRSEPTNLRVSSVGINVDLISVGQKADGSMEVPPLFEPVAGWYKFSPTPGEIGPSVIAGHVDTHKGPSVFWRLREVKSGDVIEITRADGQTVKFKVEALKQFDQANFPTEEVYGNIKHAGLRLITCGGTFNKQTGRYTENTVVYAALIEQPLTDQKV